jgi:PAS domain-containing protein
MSITEIVKTAHINRNTAGRYLENILVSGQVEMRRFGMAKICILSRGVPLSAVLSISSDMVLQLDNNLRITFVNQPFLDLIGTDEKEVLGKILSIRLLPLFLMNYSPVLSKISGRELKVRNCLERSNWQTNFRFDTPGIWKES